MLIQELIGKKVTNIYAIVEYEHGGLDKGECFVELDNNIVIDIPFGDSDDVWIKLLDNKAMSIFSDLSDYPVYHVNKDKKSIKEIAGTYQKRKRSFFNRIKRALFGHEIIIKEYQPYKIEYRENKLKYIINRIIVDFLWYHDEIEKGFFLLDNGYIITETTIANNGTGLAGLNYYEDILQLTEFKGGNYKRLSENKKDSSQQ
jgi:hypothetical protein